MIEVRGLTKRYGRTLAVDDLSFTVQPGVVTGFLGPNGAGKTTTMRLILGLDQPSAGTVTVDGRPHRQAVSPMREVGALIDARAAHGGRSAGSGAVAAWGRHRAGHHQLAEPAAEPQHVLRLG
jgi:ABC-2 type transport system ATP-binding protein